MLTEGVTASFTVILSPEPGYGYSVHCPAMPGAVSQGRTRSEARDNVVDALRLMLSPDDEEGNADESLELHVQLSA